MVTRLRATGMPIRDVRRYAELVRAGDVTLTREDLDALERAVPRDAVMGERYGDMSTIEA